VCWQDSLNAKKEQEGSGWYCNCKAPAIKGRLHLVAVRDWHNYKFIPLLLSEHALRLSSSIHTFEYGVGYDVGYCSDTDFSVSVMLLSRLQWARHAPADEINDCRVRVVMAKQLYLLRNRDQPIACESLHAKLSC
jgi:hypothetical protein